MANTLVVALLGNAADQLSALEGAGDSTVQFCSNAEEAARALAQVRAVAAVIELHDRSGTDLGTIQRAIASRVPTIPLLIRLDLTAPSIRKIIGQDTDAFDVRFSLQGHDSLAECLSRLLRSTAEPDAAHHAIISGLSIPAHNPVADILVGAAIMGDRRTTVRQLAAACSSSERRVEERLSVAGLMGAKKLLMRMLVIHTHWRITRVGWTSKRAATAAGFDSVDPLSRRIERATGQRLAALCNSRSFEDELSRLVDDLT